MSLQQTNVCIIGGGIVGLSLACALGQVGIQVIVVDPLAQHRDLSDEPELRVSAINPASERLLTQLGVWQKIQRLSPYQHMQVWEQDSFAQIDFAADELNLPHLGCIVENQALVNALIARAETLPEVQLLAHAKLARFDQQGDGILVQLDNQTLIQAKLLVGADGVQSQVRRQAAMPQTFWDYEQTAIVASIKTALPHKSCARQVFTPFGPLAFLPLAEPHSCSIVWSQDNAKASALLALDEAEFAKQLTATFDNRLGPCELASERQSFALKMGYARQWSGERVVLVGDAAHSIHPLAGLGANLGLADVQLLSTLLAEQPSAAQDIGQRSVLRAYERERKAEAMQVITAMHGFRYLFAGDHPLKKLTRGLGLVMADKLPGLKRSFIAQAAGLHL